MVFPIALQQLQRRGGGDVLARLVRRSRQHGLKVVGTLAYSKHLGLSYASRVEEINSTQTQPTRSVRGRSVADLRRVVSPSEIGIAGSAALGRKVVAQFDPPSVGKNDHGLHIPTACAVPGFALSLELPFLLCRRPLPPFGAA